MVLPSDSINHSSYDSNSWMVYFYGTSENRMNENWGYPHDSENLRLDQLRGLERIDKIDIYIYNMI
jgi:hypothetical protein